MKRIIPIAAVVAAMLGVVPAAAEAKSTKKVAKIVTRYAQSQGYAVAATFCDRITRRMWVCNSSTWVGNDIHTTVWASRGGSLRIRIDD